MKMKIKEALALINKNEKQKKVCVKPKMTSEARRTYYERNREVLKEKARKYYWDNIEKRKQSHAEWYQKNREYVQEYQRAYNYNRKHVENNNIIYDIQQIEAV